MTDQSQTTTNTPSDPILCKLGCGFFGNPATGGYCSKCFRDVQKSKAQCEVAPPSPSPAIDAYSSSTEKVSAAAETKTTETPAAVASKPLSVEEVSMTDANVAVTETTATPKSSETAALTTTSDAPVKKKKPKKKSYKNMMASMMKQSSSRDEDKEKEKAIRKVTGGGAFSKIEKI